MPPQSGGQNNTLQFKRIEAIQNETVKIINFANHFDSPSLSYKSSKILKLRDHIKLQNFLFTHDSVNKHLPPALLDNFELVSNKHNYETRLSCNKSVSFPNIRTTTFGLKNISFQSAVVWNFFMKKLNHQKLHQKSRSFCKHKITEYLLESYWFLAINYTLLHHGSFATYYLLLLLYFRVFLRSSLMSDLWLHVKFVCLLSSCLVKNQ